MQFPVCCKSLLPLCLHQAGWLDYLQTSATSFARSTLRSTLSPRYTLASTEADGRPIRFESWMYTPRSRGQSVSSGWKLRYLRVTNETLHVFRDASLMVVKDELNLHACAIQPRDFGDNRHGLRITSTSGDRGPVDFVSDSKPLRNQWLRALTLASTRMLRLHGTSSESLPFSSRRHLEMTASCDIFQEDPVFGTPGTDRVVGCLMSITGSLAC